MGSATHCIFVSFLTYLFIYLHIHLYFTGFVRRNGQSVELRKSEVKVDER